MFNLARNTAKGVVTYASITNCGDRPVNEDSVGFCHNGDSWCFILCDGLGGHGMGDVASSLVVDVFKRCFADADSCDGFLDNAFVAGQEILLAEQMELNRAKQMKTTAVALVLDGVKKTATIGYIGDSRGYYFFKGSYRKRTLDHSIPQMLVMTHEIKEKEIRNHPERNIVLRVMGIKWESNMYEVLDPIPYKGRQAFLLCSDGFWELIEEKEMCSLLKESNNPAEWLTRMEAVVKQNGEGRNMDNYSAIAVWWTK